MTTLDDLDELLGGKANANKDNWKRLVIADDYDPLDLDTLGAGSEAFDPDAFTFREEAIEGGNDEDLDHLLDDIEEVDPAGIADEFKPFSKVELSAVSQSRNLKYNQTEEIKIGPLKKVAPGHCYQCEEIIYGELVQLEDNLEYHSCCWLCVNCGDELAGQPYYEVLNAPHCKKCYIEMMSPKCAACQETIDHVAIDANGAKFHKECFTCAGCSNLLDALVYEKDGKFYCPGDFYSMLGPVCKVCQKPVTDMCVNVLGNAYHPEHFECTYCHVELGLTSYYNHQDLPFCIDCWYRQNDAYFCEQCNQPILGQATTEKLIQQTYHPALGRAYHPEHFNCTLCGGQLGGGVFTEHHEKAYCPTCYSELFG